MASKRGSKGTVTKSELVERIAEQQSQLGYRDVELAVRSILDLMAMTLANGERIEIRGFGSFCLHHRPSRVGRNPKTGDPVSLPEKYVPHFKPGKELRDRVDAAAAAASKAGRKAPGAGGASGSSPAARSA